MQALFKEKLGLSDEQVKNLEAIRASFQEEAEKRSVSSRRAEAELQELLTSEPVDLQKSESFPASRPSREAALDIMTR